ncbi:MAG: polymerase subunit epsilon [Solirubrobacteraceae bacterium]|jgi:DNA polymerase-3 subunit epsilon|nr:polymerase subunit epsilon [Solirubrobacteraceae bacterium]
MDTIDAPLRTAEFLAVDVETNGCARDACELTEVGAVLVGGGELHERWSSLVAARAPLSAGIQRFTGISQAMVDAAPEPAAVLPELAARLEGRVLVAHSARFDRGVLAAAFERAGLRWPDPPVLCTVTLARRLAPLVRRRSLGPLAAALGVEQEGAHRALVDAETCARVFCALFPRLCANAVTVREAVGFVAPRRRRRAGRRPPGRLAAGAPAPAVPLDFSALPNEPGVYVFRDCAGRPLYVGKSKALRTRARSHFAPGAQAAGWTSHAALVDHRETESELGALVLENRLIKELRPPGNVALRRSDSYVYLRARLDIAYPILEVAPEPAPGHAINVGPLSGHHSARELADHLTSLFSLRHCGRRLPRRDSPSAYGQMGRCLSPCLQDLDPNLYRARLDAALSPFTGTGDGREALLALVEEQMRAESGKQHFERAATLRRRRDRLATLLDRLGGDLRATHAVPRLVLAPHPKGPERFDAVWIVGGRVADWGALPDSAELARRTALALGTRPVAGPECVAPDAVHELRIVATWLQAHPEAPVLALDPPPAEGALFDFRSNAASLAA